jgi:DNA modification methylase
MKTAKRVKESPLIAGYQTAHPSPLLADFSNERTVLSKLSSLGRLPEDFDGSTLLPFLRHTNPDIRFEAVKNLGKLKDAKFLDALTPLAKNEPNTIVRREVISSIGRMRCRRAIQILEDTLKDEDPKVVIQAVRALLYFRDDESVQKSLVALRDHPNEMIQTAIAKEFTESRMRSRKVAGAVESSDALKNVFVNGDVRDVLQLVPDESVHLTFTSPPYYNARDYTLYKSYDEYLEFLVGIFREVHRVTKEGRFFVLNTSPVLLPRMSRSHASTRYLIPFDIHPRITKLGFDFIEDIIWTKPDPSAKNRNGGFFQHRKPLGYKANSVTEYVIVYRKHTDKLIDWNMAQYDDATTDASKVHGDYEKTNVWKIAPSSDLLHPAIFPKELASRVIQFYSYKGDLVFDPFGGIGTVAKAALSLDRYFFLTELEKKYFEKAQSQLLNGNLFSRFQPKFISYAEFKEATHDSGKNRD